MSWIVWTDLPTTRTTAEGDTLGLMRVYHSGLSLQAQMGNIKLELAVWISLNPYIAVQYKTETLARKNVAELVSKIGEHGCGRLDEQAIRFAQVREELPKFEEMRATDMSSEDIAHDIEFAKAKFDELKRILRTLHEEMERGGVL